MPEKPTGNLIPFPDSVRRENLKWNQGYHDGYVGRGPAETEGTYITAFYVGRDDREEDEGMIEENVFDGISESEREFLYGYEEKLSEYREE